ncbi:MAG: sigma-54 dependent transcriptional regulator [Planctomycetaceae bacterium]|jgi:two-component system NtrC family response regulator|nr:sigma-54 dependent transcriptional regulator [Planctomycetaceae bacterium]
MKSHFADEELIGNSAPMQSVRKLINRIARTDSTVVILGETGSGKELVAKSIHSHSLRSTNPFIAVNCGALPENLIESELFGHRKGSFTGADSNRTGLLEIANGGTLFLDEIGELSKTMQSKLLRFLENGEIRKIGDNTTTLCNVRVICATLKDLESMVNTGDFREDLWFRINTFIIRLPALRERLEDLPDLIQQLVKRFRPNLKIDQSKDKNNTPDIFTKQAFNRLINYDWPGNIRQLANTIEHALVLADKLPIDIDSLPELIDSRNSTTELTTNIPIQKRNAENRPEVCKNALDSSILLPIVNTSIPTKNNTTINTPDSVQSEITVDSKSAPLDSTNTESPPTLRELENKAILEAIKRNAGNKVKAAEELRISLKTLYNKLKEE